MQLPNITPVRPWPIPLDLDLPILSYLTPAEAAAFSRASRGCLAIIKRLDEPLFASSSIKPERFKQLSWRKIALNQYRYPKTKKEERRSNNPSIAKESQIKRIGQMISIKYKEEQRLIDYKANLFRILPLEDKVVHASFLSALVFRKGRYEIFDRHFQTPIKMPAGVEVDPSHQAIMCFEGEKAAVVVSKEGEKRLLLADRKSVTLLDGAFGEGVQLYSLNELLAVVNGLSLTLFGFDGILKKTIAFANEIKKCKVSSKDFWVATSREIVVYDFKSLNQKKFFPIVSPDVMYINGYLVEFRANLNRFVVTADKIAYSDPLVEGTKITYYKEVDGLLYLKLNHVAYVYDLKENKLTHIDTGVLIGSDHFWIEKHLVLISGNGDTYKMIG